MLHRPTIDPFERAVTVEQNPDGADVLVLCDHASNALPPEYGTLGLAEAEFRRHIALDIGALGVSRRLAQRLGAALIRTGFSRLLIDPNRGPDDPTLVMKLSDGAIIPGNHHADAAEVEHRARSYFWPYHDAITAWIDDRLARGIVPAIVSIHSFTPAWKSVPRPWQVAVLWDADPRLNVPLIEALREQPGLVVGDNEPYDGALKNDTMHRHATGRGLAHTLIEVRQDLIADDETAAAWGDRLADALIPLLARPEMKRISYHGSRTARRGAATLTDRRRSMADIDPATMTELEAAAFRRLVEHLRGRTDVQNIDLMNLAGFCRNCLSNWLKDAADARGIAMSKDESREHVYGEPYEQWRAKHQKEASADQQAAFEKNRPAH